MINHVIYFGYYEVLFAKKQTEIELHVERAY